MLPKPPNVSLGQSGIDAYRDRLRDHTSALRNKLNRSFYRKELEIRAKRYRTLAGQRPLGSAAALHFFSFAHLHQEELERFGPEPAAKPRPRNLQSVPLIYPQLPDEFTLRVHFLEGGSLRRERSAVLAVYADAISRQQASNGDVLLSVAVHPSRAQFFERLIESIGPNGLGARSGKNGGFHGYVTSEGRIANVPGWQDADSPWLKMRNENFQARLYHWSLRRGQLDTSITLPDDLPAIPDSLPWDPDPRFNEILSLTQADRLEEAMEVVDKIPATDREIIFDEVIYLCYLVGEPPRGGDLRYLARKYIAGSSIRSRLEEEFEAFITCLDEMLSNSGPIPDDFPGLGGMADILQQDPNPLIRETPPLKNWKATRNHYYRQFEAFGHPVRPRGRVFIWHPGLASGSLSSMQNAFADEFIAAENSFRRARSIAEIGRGWASETALLDLVRGVYPDAVHQWRPAFLGFQSIDIYVPSLNLSIEYQGEQHYRPIEIFGGEEGFVATESRDARKRALLAANSVSLLEWRYDRPLSRLDLESALREFQKL